MTEHNAMIETLSTLTERDEAGRHFTETASAEMLDALESAGLIKIDRRMHENGIAYSQEYWRLEITEDGLAEVAAAL
jgi:hypothetical protein